MKHLKYILLFSTVVALSFCKRKTTINITAYNYALAEPIADANVVIIERKSGGGIFTPAYSCKEIAHANTDVNGECEFDKERLKTNKGYDYFAVVNYAYGKSQSYPCGGKTSGYLNVGKTNNEVLNYSDFDCYFKIQYNNLLNPAQPGDSMAIGFISQKYSVPGQPYPFGGGGVFSDFNSYYDPSYPYPSSIGCPILKSNAGKHVLYTYKKKMGVVSETYDTIKIYPYETRTIQINW